MIGTKEISAPSPSGRALGEAPAEGLPIRITAVPMGITAGLLAVLAGALFEVRPPEAYGICMACHARDLVNWTWNLFGRTHLEVAPASLVFPVLTPIGVLLGALIAATINREFRWQNPESSWKAFVYVRDTYLLRGLITFGLTAWLGFPLVGLLVGSRPASLNSSDAVAVVLTIIGGFGVGYVSTLANGCPFRQHVLAAQGVTTAIAYLAGFFAGAVIFHTWVTHLMLYLLP